MDVIGQVSNVELVCVAAWGAFVLWAVHQLTKKSI
jgi:hypothetical protein